MAGRFSQKFTLTDIFNNKKLRGKLPLINYKETELENGKVSRRTNMKTINRLAFDTAQSAARPFYQPMQTTRSGNIMEIGGTLTGDIDGAVNAVYNALMSQKGIMSYTANDMVLLRSALKEGEKNKRKWGNDTKLYLRCQSMEEIEGMSKKQLEALMRDIKNNVLYSSNFLETQQKYKVDQMPNERYSYSQRQLDWKMKVGEKY